MGWKLVKDHYRIGHIVHVRTEGICIGSPYIPEILIIGNDGVLKKRDDKRDNEDLRRYLSEFDADPELLKRLVLEPDPVPGKTVTVWTYAGAAIIEKQCEEPGWPNTTIDGELMYENTFSTDKEQVVRWAKESAMYGVKAYNRTIAKIEKELAEQQSERAKCESNAAKLAADFPSVTV